ncbi:hypothetical protein R3P38DRAFT_3475656 [Favolaschia claudopus]|uniref:Uncharacterized protein n=1 Tax=Favolaschia claudopus TaxID=2862362 RepID=A0AAW0CI20_9AGAR
MAQVWARVPNSPTQKPAAFFLLNPEAPAFVPRTLAAAAPARMVIIINPIFDGYPPAMQHLAHKIAHLPADDQVYLAWLDVARAAHPSEYNTLASQMISIGVLCAHHTQSISKAAGRLVSDLMGSRGEDLFGIQLRDEAVNLFMAHWNKNGPWQTEDNVHSNEYLTSRGVNIAAFLGSLFSYDFVSGPTLQQCLYELASDSRTPHPRRLMALDALVTQAGKAFVTWDGGESSFRMGQRLMKRTEDGRGLVWAMDERSGYVINHLFMTLNEWGVTV